MTLLNKVAQPGFDINKLSQKEKIKLVRESDGALVDILEGEEIRGMLDLEDCDSLTHLPAGLKVRGDFYIRCCTSLTCFPKEFKVGGNLYVRDCAAQVHSGVKVRGKIIR